MLRGVKKIMGAIKVRGSDWSKKKNDRTGTREGGGEVTRMNVPESSELHERGNGGRIKEKKDYPTSTRGGMVRGEPGGGGVYANPKNRGHRC